ncbi:MAG: methyltransferase domain-containing protein [Phycisphaerales bacterium]
MKLSHFEAFAPLCPICTQKGEGSRLDLTRRDLVEGELVVHGMLTCVAGACQAEYPIVDGVPILLANAREYIASQHLSLTRRTDLPAAMDSTLAECAGPGSWDDVIRQHLSSAMWDHYGDWDEPAAPAGAVPGAVARLVGRAAELGGVCTSGPVLDIGCGVGRSSFELSSRGSGLVLGIDMHGAMTRAAQQVLRTGRVGYYRRSMGLLYEHREFEVELPAGASRVDFWIMDACNPCLAASSFGGVCCLNVLDCVPVPMLLLARISELLAAGGRAAIATPFDWSANVTPLETWIGGHSPRGAFGGKSDELLAALLTPGAHPVAIEGLRLIADERKVPWHVRLHNRALMRYEVQMVVAEKFVATGHSATA